MHASLCATSRTAQPATQRSVQGCSRGVQHCTQIVDGWLDMAKLVTSSGNQSKTPYDDLAYSIGKDVYVDIAGWHLFLRDMTAAPGLKMSQALAAQLGPQLAKSRDVDEASVEKLLKKVPVTLGGGKLKVSIYEVMPSMCVRDMAKICSQWANQR